MHLLRVWIPSAGLLESELLLDWASFDSKGKLVTQGQNTLGDLPPASRHELWLPFDRVLLTTVSLPKQSRHQLQRVAPFALEDKLLSSPELSHCALGHAEGNVWSVAVVEKNWLLPVLATFRATGRVVNAVWPAWNALPVGAAVWLGSEGWWRNEKHLGAYLTSVPEDDVLCFKPGNQEWRGRNPDGEAINLLQGSLAGQPRVAGAKSPWRLTAVLASAVVLLFYGQLGWGVYQQNKQAKSLSRELNQNFYKVFPESATMVDPLLQLERKIQEAGSGGGMPPADDALVLLNKATPLVAGHGLVKGLEYTTGELKLSLKLEAQQLEELTGKAKAAGLMLRSDLPAKVDDPTTLKLRPVGAGS